ncbi:hypothetical protein D3C84_737460 [compost metagenome]
MFVDAGFLRLGRRAGPSGRAFLLAFGQGFFQGRFGLLKCNPGAATVNLFAGESLGGDFDVRRQQHHIRLGNRRGAQRIARTDRALGFHLQVITQAFGRLLQGFGGHEGVRDAGRAGGDRDQSRDVVGNGNGFDNCFGRRVHLRFLGSASQQRINILQGLGRGALEHPLANKSGHVHWRAGHQQYPLGIVDGRGRQLAFRVCGIADFDAGAPALTLGRGIQQPGAQHTGDHAVRAGRNNG